MKDLDEGIAIARKSRYGNAACLYTTNGKIAREFKYRVPASMIGINLGIAAPMSFFPFGGARDSFFGDIKGHGREIVPVLHRYEGGRSRGGPRSCFHPGRDGGCT